MSGPAGALCVFPAAGSRSRRRGRGPFGGARDQRRGRSSAPTRRLPFGGVGRSGHGSYHGVHGFELFSQKRAVLNAATWLDPPVRYPPYRGKLGLLRLLLR